MRRRMYETFGSITDIEEMVSDIDDTCDNIEDYLRNMNQGIHAIFTLLRGWDESRGQLKEGLAVMAEPLQMATLQSYDPINRDTIKRIADKRIARQLDDFEELIRKIINKKIRRHEKEEHSSWDCFEDNVREIVYGMFEKHNDIRRFLDDRAREEAGDISADDNE